MLEKMPAEPAWSKSISSTTVCTWFWFIGLLNAFAAVLAVFSVLLAVSKGRAMAGMLVPLALVGLGFVNAWALFLVCNRGLHAEGFGAKMKKAAKIAGNMAFTAATGQKSPF
jgi:hypothetical protein